VLDERGFDLGRRQTVATDINHVVYTTSDPVVALVVAACTVARELL
jgi:hypothetical protein